MCLYNFSSFSQHFFYSYLDLIEFFKCMTWQSMFLLLFFFSFFFHDLSTQSNDVCHRWPSKLKHLFSCEDLFWKGWLLVRGCSYHFCPEKNMAQKYSREMGNFLSICPEASIKVISKYHDLGILFCSLKRFGRFETVASFDAYQITKYQFFFKKQNRHFLLPDFRRIREISFYREFYGQMPEQVWSKGLFDFSKSCPLGYHIFIQTISQWKEAFIRITNNDHQFFRDSCCSKI